jgi:hypothetical protein
MLRALMDIDDTPGHERMRFLGGWLRPANW